VSRSPIRRRRAVSGSNGGEIFCFFLLNGGASVSKPLSHQITITILLHWVTLLVSLFTTEEHQNTLFPLLMKIHGLHSIELLHMLMEMALMNG
jgi:hypothetical protein